ncbi:MAG: hypothetical protein N4A38_02625 [Candidatus Gracilibacteria bacterium]|nr:hypothetical protein [Candidatus Gracilibacteria bacterium]
MSNKKINLNALQQNTDSNISSEMQEEEFDLNAYADSLDKEKSLSGEEEVVVPEAPSVKVKAEDTPVLKQPKEEKKSAKFSLKDFNINVKCCSNKKDEAKESQLPEIKNILAQNKKTPKAPEPKIQATIIKEAQGLKKNVIQEKKAPVIKLTQTEVPKSIPKAKITNAPEIKEKITVSTFTPPKVEEKPLEPMDELENIALEQAKLSAKEEGQKETVAIKDGNTAGTIITESFDELFVNYSCEDEQDMKEVIKQDKQNKDKVSENKKSIEENLEQEKAEIESEIENIKTKQEIKAEKKKQKEEEKARLKAEKEAKKEEIRKLKEEKLKAKAQEKEKLLAQKQEKSEAKKLAKQELKAKKTEEKANKKATKTISTKLETTATKTKEKARNIRMPRLSLLNIFKSKKSDKTKNKKPSKKINFEISEAKEKFSSKYKKTILTASLFGIILTISGIGVMLMGTFNDSIKSNALEIDNLKQVEAQVNNILEESLNITTLENNIEESIINIDTEENINNPELIEEVETIKTTEIITPELKQKKLHNYLINKYKNRKK